LKTTFKFRMYPNQQQEAQLNLTLDTCRYLYNTALADRKNTYESEHISRSYEDQAGMLTIEKNACKDIRIHATAPKGQMGFKFAAAQRNISRKKNKVAMLHRRIHNHRDEFLHQVSRKLVDSADLDVFYNLNILGMPKNHHPATHIQDHAWGNLIPFA
jgi:putative transposase